MLNTVRIPPQFEPLFAQAQDYVQRYFQDRHFDPTQGTIEIFGQRYILVRSAAMSIEFFDIIKHLYADKGSEEANAIARNLLFDLAHAIGIADAKNFHAQMNLVDPIEKLSAGPIHFSHTGWAFVDIFPESQPTPDENFYLLYDHPYSFESASWVAAGSTVNFPVCAMNAGYSSGWCEESFGVPLVAVEILCCAKGDEHCRFIMGHPNQIETHIRTYLNQHPSLNVKASQYEIPGFFKRKKIESDLRDREEEYRSVFEASTDGILIVTLDGIIVSANPATTQIFDYPEQELDGLSIKNLFPGNQTGMFEQLKATVQQQGHVSIEGIGQTKHHRQFGMELHAKVFSYRRQEHLLVIIRDITERKQIEADHRRLQAEITALSTPLIPISDTVVLMPLIGTLDAHRVEQVIDTLLKGIMEHHANTAILDITGVPIVDTHIANALLRAARASQLIGANVILTGIRPEVAQTLVGLGVDLGGITTHGSLQHGISAALRGN